MMSLAMLRGRELVIGLLRVVGQDDRALAAVRILDVRRGQMQRADHRLVALARTLANVLSSPSPVEPKARNGLLMPALQLAPVMNLREMLAPCVKPD